MRYKSLSLFIILLSCFGVWWWSRSYPWARAKCALDNGEPGEAVELLVESLGLKSWPPEQEEAMMELLAEGYWGKSAIESAEQAMISLREKYPKNFYATLGLGILNIMRDRGSFGVEYLEEAKHLDPKDIRPYIFLGHYFANNRDYRKAELNLASGFVRFPNDERLVKLAGDLLFNQGKFYLALIKYQPLLISTPVDRDLRIKVAQTFMSSGDLDKATEILTSLRPASGADDAIEALLSRVLYHQGHRQESAAIHERLYREDNRRLFSGIHWACALGANGRIKEAENILALIGEKLPPLGGGYSTPVAGQTFDDLDRLQLLRAGSKALQVAHLQAKATLAEYAGNYFDASQYLERALNFDDGDYGTMSDLAELARLKKEPEVRLKWANRAVSIYKEHPAALLLRASALLDMRRTPDAIIDARRVADLYPRLAYAQALLSKAWMIEKNPTSALFAAEQAVRLNPGTPEAQLALAIAQSSLRRGNEAETAFRQAIDIDPRFAEARYEWGLWLKAKGRLGEANIQFKEASRLEPRNYGSPR